MRKKMGKIILSAVLAILLILFIVVLFFTHNAAKSIAYPKGNTLEEEEAWEKEHGFRANRYGAVKYVDTYIDLGYNCIIYYMRGHGKMKFRSALFMGSRTNLFCQLTLKLIRKMIRGIQNFI